MLGKRKYAAISDVHGCADQLEDAVDRVRRFAPDARLVFLGDYIDRGNQHARTLEILREEQRRGAITLLGNHDAFYVLTAAGDLAYARCWSDNGGIVTCEEMFGFVPETSRPKELGAPPGRAHVWDYRDKLMSGPWMDFYRGCRFSYADDKLFFSHAPRRPNKKGRLEFLDERELMLWGRFSEDAQRYKVPEPYVLSVHGHVRWDGIRFPIIVNYKHGSTMKRVVLADCDVGVAGLHPIIVDSGGNILSIL